MAATPQNTPDEQPRTDATLNGRNSLHCKTRSCTDSATHCIHTDTEMRETAEHLLTTASPQNTRLGQTWLVPRRTHNACYLETPTPLPHHHPIPASLPPPPSLPPTTKHPEPSERRKQGGCNHHTHTYEVMETLICLAGCCCYPGGCKRQRQMKLNTTPR